MKAGDAVTDDDPVYVALADAAHRFADPAGAFDDLIDGCAMDASGVTYETYASSCDYCRKVAGSVGRLSLGVFGSTDPDAGRLADDLGVALQLTNILRDVVEDRGDGRVYLPARTSSGCGCARDLAGPAGRGRRARALRGGPRGRLVRRGAPAAADARPAQSRLRRRDGGHLPPAAVRIAADPEAVLDGRQSLPTWEKAWVAARSLAGVAT